MNPTPFTADELREAEAGWRNAMARAPEDKSLGLVPAVVALAVIDNLRAERDAVTSKLYAHTSKLLALCPCCAAETPTDDECSCPEWCPNA